MTGDYITRLAERVEQLATDWGCVDEADKRDAIAAELRALARTDHVEDRLGMVAEGWRCFHCSEAFTDAESAALHFGTHERQEPACIIDIAKYREMEALQLRYLDEDADVHRTMRRMETDHQQALRRAEESGYAKGLADAVKYPKDASPSPAHSAGVGGMVAKVSAPDGWEFTEGGGVTEVFDIAQWPDIGGIWREDETGLPVLHAEGDLKDWPSGKINAVLVQVNRAQPADADAEGGK